MLLKTCRKLSLEPCMIKVYLEYISSKVHLIFGIKEEGSDIYKSLPFKTNSAFKYYRKSYGVTWVVEFFSPKN